MKGFKIICLKCGNEQVINELLERKEISIHATGYDGEIGIFCLKCDNEKDPI